MQDYKERIANAWKASDKPPKEWISNHTLNIVREARIRLKARGKDDYTLYELSRECNMSSSIVTACMWSLTKGKTYCREHVRSRTQSMRYMMLSVCTRRSTKQARRFVRSATNWDSLSVPFRPHLLFWPLLAVSITSLVAAARFVWL